MSIEMAVVGAGYWGPNLIRNIMATPECDLLWVCDLDEDQAKNVLGRYSTVGVTSSLDAVLNDPRVRAVAVATPASTHFDIGSKVLNSGRHLLVEKPIAATAAEAEALVALADRLGLTIMCDHTYCYTPAVHKIRELVESGELGDIQYVDSVRVNLGLVQRDVNVIWDLAPHDLSIFDAILPPELRPTQISAFGSDPVGAGQDCLAYLSLPLGNGGIAHAHVNWLSPVKIRTMVVGGSRCMVVWDDLSTTQKISIYDRGVERIPDLVGEQRARAIVSYRTGEMVAPALREGEALRAVIAEFARSITQGTPPLTDGLSGLRVIRLLEAASRSLASGGALVDAYQPQLTAAKSGSSDPDRQLALATTPGLGGTP